MHVGFVAGLICRVPVNHIQPVTVFPVGRVFRKAFDGRADTFGIHVAMLVLPAFLKDYIYFGGIPSRYVNSFTESGCFDPVIRPGGLHLVVEYNGFRGFRERNPGIQFTLRVFRVLDGFVHLSQVNGARYKHGDVHDPQHFAFLHECFNTHAITVVSFLRENGDTAFCDSADFCHHVGSSPRGNRGTDIGFVSSNRVQRGNLVEDFRVTANNKRFVNDANHPAIKVSEWD